MITRFDGGFQRLAAVAVLAAALGLAGCGRKGPLDPPPGATATAQGQTSAEQQLGPDGRPVSGQKKRSEPFALDWLID